MNEPTINELLEEQKVQDFFLTILQDETLLQQFMTAADANDEDTLIKLASDRGYDLNKTSLRQGLKNIMNLIAPIVLVEQDF